MSYGMFYSFMLTHLVDGEWGEEFDRNYRYVVIHDMISTLREFVDHESNKGRQNLKVFVGVTVTVHHHLDERILFEESSNNRMVPASKSSMQLLKRIEVDGSIMMNEDCAICLEELGKEQRELLCMPCSHIFHGDCITKWLENGHCCPICRYQMPTK
ncbi:E3 ubiquitin-protein ligase SGR9, amyloplastic-like [Lycium barbarum]|uniref:E3 ubiquitin-protein ligase SGR9, amyloplastic-like n=1 Tax=Lycium barbarum TaxID=112863 RepID=UPI00293F691F|nr:E3 ubiquitin-protein ligase SGR9, amyloplastic-like [Lycium barbarum]